LDKNKKTISISNELYDLIFKRIAKTNEEFSSVDDYVEFVLNELFEDELKTEEISDEEKEKIEKELKKMGYI